MKKQIAYRNQNDLISSHMKLVISIARNYQNRGLEMEDLIQEGNYGLIKASEKYDHSLGFEFSTYATFWIKQAILKAIYNTGRTIRLPVHLRGELSKLLQASKKLSGGNQLPTLEELAQETGLDEDAIQELQSYIPDTISLDTPIGQEKDSTLGDMIADDSASAEDMSEELSLKKAINDMLLTLKPKEAEVLRLRFGLDTDEELTLEQIGQMKNVTRERIRQIEMKALESLRHKSKKDKWAKIA